MLRPPISPESFLLSDSNPTKPERMNSVLDFVQSLQEMKKSQMKWAGLPLEERSLALKAISKALKEKTFAWTSRWASSQSLPEAFVRQDEVLPAIRCFERVSDIPMPAGGNLPKATGLISILLPEMFSLRILSERLAPALLAGNGVYIWIPPQASLLAEILGQVLDPALPVKVLTGGDDLAEILTAHPGIQAVSCAGSAERAERTLKALAGSWKKWQITGGYHNAALVLADADFALAAQKLVESCFTGMGQLPWNISTIYVTETQLPAFQEAFVSALKEARFGELGDSVRQRTEQLAGQLRSEKAKVLFGGEAGQPLVVEDLSHCSVLQQDCLNAPVVLVSPVKYAHEMVKWTNTSYYGMFAQIFGSPEKIEKFAGQLDVSRVAANSWIESMATLPLGMKQSFSGIPDLEPFGGFFSDQRKIDGWGSKF